MPDFNRLAPQGDRYTRAALAGIIEDLLLQVQRCLGTDDAGAQKMAAAMKKQIFPGASDRCALDAASTRSYDADGRLHVGLNNISKAAVNEYLGSEIPGHEALGLQPDRLYRLLRDPEELKKAVPTFNNLPLLSRHVPVSAEKPEKDLIIGSLGTDAEFKPPYLRNSLVVWDAGAIKGVENGDQKEISCAYRYVPDMTPGIYEGQPYDGRMTKIIGNHAAVVPSGRVGADCVVGDEQPNISGKSMNLSRCIAALEQLLPTLDPDAQDRVKQLIAEIGAGAPVDADMSDTGAMAGDAVLDLAQRVRVIG